MTVVGTASGSGACALESPREEHQSASRSSDEDRLSITR
jgi:hypothetical protein